MNDLAWFLIDKERNIKEGMELADKAIKLRPDNYSDLHTKGWGLYKQGKYQEAFDIIQNSWDIRREKSIYNHEAYLHLEAAKKAVAGQDTERLRNSGTQRLRVRKEIYHSTEPDKSDKKNLSTY